MNVMAIAHSDTRDYMAQQARFAPKAGPTFVALTYRQVFAAMLKNAHWHFKNEATKMTKEQTIKAGIIAESLNTYPEATGFAIVGTVMFEGSEIRVGESSGSELRMQNDATYYMNTDNGFTNQDIHLEVYGVHGVISSYKILK